MVREEVQKSSWNPTGHESVTGRAGGSAEWSHRLFLRGTLDFWRAS